MRPRDDELRCGDGSDAGLLEQDGAGGDDELLDLGFVLGGFGLQRQGSTGRAADCPDGCAVFGCVSRRGPQARATLQLFVGRAAAQLVT